MTPAESEAKPIEQNKVKNSRLETMKGHNMPNGFARYKIHATFEGGQEKLVGSFFCHGRQTRKSRFYFKEKTSGCF